MQTFSIGFDVERLDETRVTRARSPSSLGTRHHEFTVEPDALDVLPRLVWHYGEPFADASAIPHPLPLRARAPHVTVALNGDGGDESFAGYGRYHFHDVVRR